MMEYRKRCYAYYSTLWEQMHTGSVKEYELFAKIATRKYKGLLPASKAALVIDVGCGAGHFLYFLQKEGYMCSSGIDVSQEQIDVARQMGVTGVEKADVFDYLGSHVGTYDMVIANDIIEHLTKDEIIQFLDLVHSSLREGGRILISTVNASSLFGAAAVYTDFTHEQAFTSTSLNQVLRICRFRNIDIRGDAPVAHDVRSATRVLLWSIIKSVLHAYQIIETGTGRGVWKRKLIFEPRLVAIAERSSEGQISP